MKDNRKTIQLLLIFTVIFSIMGGSLAYWNWNTTEGQKTNVVFTVTQDFSCAADGGGNITSNDVSLAPTTCTDTSRAIKRKVTVTPTLNRETMTLSMDLWLTINDLGEGLKKSNNFRYVLTTSDSNCEEGTIMASGNFKGRKVGNKVNLFTNELYTETPTEPEEYWLYIWLDEEETSSSTMNQTFSLSLGGQCEEVETLKGDAYALLFEDGGSVPVWNGYDTVDSPTYDLIFVRSETPIEVDDEYDGKVVKHVYSGIETTTSVPWVEYSMVINSVGFKDTIRPISTSGWFDSLGYYDGLNSYADIDLNKLDTSQVTNMSHMFSGDGGLVYAYGNLTGLENLDTSKVTDMSYMFLASSYTINKVISNWDVSNVEDMTRMFSESYNISNFDLSNWDVSNVTNMREMFMSTMDTACISDDISSWNVANVVNMSYMFYYSNIDNLGNISTWDTSGVLDMSYMYYFITLNTILDLSDWDVSNVSSYSSFSEDSTVTVIPPVWRNAYLKIYSETDKSLRIYNDLNVPSVGDVYDGRTVTNVYDMSAGNGYFNCNSSITPITIVAEDNITPISLDEWFKDCTKIKYVDVSKINVSNISSLYKTFYNVGNDSSVTSFTILGLDKWNTSNVTRMYQTFYNMGLNANYTLDLSGWDVSKVTNHTDFDYGVTDKIIDPLWK